MTVSAQMRFKEHVLKMAATETKKYKKLAASSGNRTRAARVAGEHSTTEPTMLTQGKQTK